MSNAFALNALRKRVGLEAQKSVGKEFPLPAPEAANTKNLSGQWVMNKRLSGDFDSVLVMQGVSWLTRKAIGIATITLHIRQYNDENGVEHIDIIDYVGLAGKGGLKGTGEFKTYDDQWRGHTDYIFGSVKSRNKRTKVSSLNDVEEDERFLKTGWAKDVMDADEVIDSFSESLDKDWKARQCWGFEVVDEQRHFVRHLIVRKGDEVKRVKLVYDYKWPPNDK